MKIIRFYESGGESRTDVLSDFEWKDLLNEEELSDENLRFTLYEGKITDPDIFGTALFLDMDKMPITREDYFLSWIEKKFSFWEYYVLHTGNGYHIYIPLKNYFPKEEMYLYKASYDELIEGYKDELGVEFDNVFKLPIHGRIPGSWNVKKGVRTRVKTLTYCEGERMESLDELLKKRMPTFKTKEKREVVEDKGCLKDNVLYKNCKIINTLAYKDEKVPNDVWIDIVGGMVDCGYVEAAHEFSKSIPDYNPKRIESLRGTEYMVVCTSLGSKYKNHYKTNMCNQCSNRKRGNTFRAITGELPTPSQVSGFHPFTEDGKGLDYNRHILDDMACYYINKNRETIFKYGGILYKFTGKHYDPAVTDFTKEHTWMSELSNEIRGYSYNPVTKEDQIKKLMRTLSIYVHNSVQEREETDDPNLISFNNGVYDLSKGEFLENSKDHIITQSYHRDYDPSIDCLMFKEFLAHTLVDEDKINLMQDFAGLALSNILNTDIQEFVWSIGDSGAGKSAFVHMLGNAFSMTQDSAVYSPETKNAISGKSGDFSMDLRGRKIFFIDELKLRNTQQFKEFEDWVTAYTAKKKLMCDVKYIQVFEVQGSLTLFVTSNNLPHKLKSDEGLARRTRLVIWHHPVQEGYERKRIIHCLNDPDEQMGIVNWALAGLKRCLKRKAETGKLTPPLTEEEKHLINESEIEEHNEFFHEEFDKILEVGKGYRGEILTDIKTALDKEMDEKMSWDQKTFCKEVINYVGRRMKMNPTRMKLRQKDGVLIKCVRLKND